MALLLPLAAATSALSAAPPLGFKPNVRGLPPHPLAELLRPSQHAPPPHPPRRAWQIIFFLADDFGHFNSGWMGNKEARTPNIDALVKQGVVMDRQCACPTPERALGGGEVPRCLAAGNKRR